ncbi:hypothetical protein D3C72_1622600 [compost metagenome]
MRLEPVTSSAITAQARPSGTVVMMMTELRTLSNCAASTRKMMAMAKPKVSNMPLEFSSSVAASPSGSRRAPGGRMDCESSFTFSSA